MQTHNRPFLVSCSLCALRDIFRIDHRTKGQPVRQRKKKQQKNAEIRNGATSSE